MTDIINFLTSHPWVLGVAVVISLMIVLWFAKRILRVLLVLVALGILFIAWVSWNGGDPAKEAQKAGETVQETVEKGGEAMKALDWFFKKDDDSQNGE